MCTSFWSSSEENDFEEVKKRIEASDIDYFDKPYRRFIGSKFEQETFFVEDPNGNVLEIKQCQTLRFYLKLQASY